MSLISIHCKLFHCLVTSCSKMLLRWAVNIVQIADRIQVLTKPLCRAQAILYALPNNERGTKYCGLTYSVRQNCPWICRATYSAMQTRLRIWSVSITIMRSIETPQTTQKHPKLHQKNYWHIMRGIFFRTLTDSSWGWGHVRPSLSPPPPPPGSDTGIVQEYIQW